MGTQVTADSTCTSGPHDGLLAELLSNDPVPVLARFDEEIKELSVRSLHRWVESAGRVKRSMFRSISNF